MILATIGKSNRSSQQKISSIKWGFSTLRSYGGCGKTAKEWRSAVLQMCSRLPNRFGCAFPCGRTWKSGKFCAECGTPKPKGYEGWICSCGSRGRGAVCSICGAPRPADVCDQCGWKPADGAPASVYCPECGYVIQKEKVKPIKIPDHYWG